VDTDCAIDDAIALALLPALLVTCVGGMVAADHAVLGARRLVGGFATSYGQARLPHVCLGLDPPNDILAVAPWARTYRERCERMLADIGMPSDAGATVHCALQPAPGDAASALIAAAREHAGNARLVCLGPLSNVAEALRREPGLFKMVAELVILGGAVRMRGSAPHGSEWNMWFDPVAAHEVFEAARLADLPLVLLSVDVANEDAIDLDSAAVRSLYKPVECTTGGADAQEQRRCYGRRLVALQPEALTMDPLAAAFVLAPETFKFEDAHVRVDKATGVTEEVVAGLGTRVRLAVSVDSHAYAQLLLRELIRPDPTD
jgi:purine nucleosidase